jgi:hypothetical protein
MFLDFQLQATMAISQKYRYFFRMKLIKITNYKSCVLCRSISRLIPHRIIKIFKIFYIKKFFKKIKEFQISKNKDVTYLISQI